VLCDITSYVIFNNIRDNFLENFVIRLNFHQGQNGAAVVI